MMIFIEKVFATTNYC